MKQFLAFKFLYCSGEGDIDISKIILGGIVNCTTIANGIIAACKETQLSMPLIVSLKV
jgi:succinyl-CoA synthetase beta subunit